MDTGPEIYPDLDDDITIVPHQTTTASASSSSSANRELLSKRERENSVDQKISFSLIVPDRCTDDVAGLENFTRVFQSRFRATSPILYIGSLEQAIQDSVAASRIEVIHRFLSQSSKKRKSLFRHSVIH